MPWGSICGLGLVIMPQVFSLLLDEYGVKGALIVIAALTSHTFVSSVLLQPIKWHMKEEIVQDEVNLVENDKLLNQGSDRISLFSNNLEQLEIDLLFRSS